MSERRESLRRLADLLDAAAGELRERAQLAERVLADPEVVASTDFSPVSGTAVANALAAATAGRSGLRATAAAIEADAELARATVETYLRLDALRRAVEQTLGPMAGRAVDALVTEVGLGEPVVVPDEPEELDRDRLLACLAELGRRHRDLVDRVIGDGLLESLWMRSLLLAPALADDTGAAARATLAALGADVGVDPSADHGGGPRGDTGADPGPADEATPSDQPGSPGRATGRASGLDERPAGLSGLMALLSSATRAVTVLRTAPGVYVVLLPGAGTGLHVVGDDESSYAERAIRALERTIRRHGDHRAPEPARVLLAGSGPGGATALDIAALSESPLFQVERVVTAGAPSAQVPRVPRYTRMISLEDRADPVTLLGSLVNAGSDNRLSLIFDGSGIDGDVHDHYLAAAHAADLADHPELQAELDELRRLGYLR